MTCHVALAFFCAFDTNLWLHIFCDRERHCFSILQYLWYLVLLVSVLYLNKLYRNILLILQLFRIPLVIHLRGRLLMFILCLIIGKHNSKYIIMSSWKVLNALLTCFSAYTSLKLRLSKQAQNFLTLSAS